jgi:hypothetical protein
MPSAQTASRECMTGTPKLRFSHVQQFRFVLGTARVGLGSPLRIIMMLPKEGEHHAGLLLRTPITYRGTAH